MTEKQSDTLIKQLFTFSTILFVALLISYVTSYYQNTFSELKQNAAAAAGRASEAVSQILTEDLNANLR